MTKEQAIEKVNKIITTKFNNDYSIDNVDKEAIEIISATEGIAVVKLDQKDIVRHKLVTRIVTAYDTYDKIKKSKTTP